VNVDVVPVGKVARDRGVALGVGLGEVLERRIREDDAEPEGVVGPVPLDDRDVVGGVRLFHEQAEVEPGRAAADRDDPHRLDSRPADTFSRPRRAFRLQMFRGPGKRMMRW
jgi:hypothetical protein